MTNVFKYRNNKKPCNVNIFCNQNSREINYMKGKMAAISQHQFFSNSVHYLRN